MSEITEQLMLIPFLVFWYLAILASCVVVLVMFISTFFPHCCVRTEKEHAYILVPTEDSTGGGAGAFSAEYLV